MRDWDTSIRLMIKDSVRDARKQAIQKEREMLQPKKFTTSPEHNVFFFSDPHLFHARDFVWKARGYNSVEEHYEAVINKLNEVVRPQDSLVCLGDWALNCDEAQFEESIARVNCKTIYMLWGNHNNPIERIYRRAVRNAFNEDIEVYPFRYKNIVFVGNYWEISVDRKTMVLCHYPIAVFNHMKHGAYHLCGHSHYNYEKTRAQYADGLYLDVGWDGHGKPLSFAEVQAIMATKNIANLDHHGNETQ